ncbi:MAG: ATP-binding protein [Planctomycetes bacterium]|jgi:PAS domain S-box-containing protein|nr:ATP-binding protein [Planctomycetota bacterium]
MLGMNLDIYTTLFGLVASIFLASFVFGRNPRSRVNRTFFVMGLTVTVWGVGILLGTLVEDPNAVKAFFFASVSGASATVASFFRFVCVFLDGILGSRHARRAGIAVLAATGVSGASVLLLLALSSWHLTGIAALDAGPRPETGLSFNIVVVWALAVMVLAIVWLIAHLPRIEDEVLRKQTLTLAFAPVVPVIAFGVLELGLGATRTGQFIGEPYFLIVVFEVVIGMGILRWGLMTLTPESAAQQILESLPDGLVLLDSEGLIRTANPAFLEMTGRKDADVVGKSLWEFLHNTDESKPSGKPPSSDHTRRFDLLLETRRPSGGTIPVSLTSKPVRDPYNRRAGTIAVLRDLTTLRRLQAEVLQAEKLSSLGQLVAGVAHEINNPLTITMGLADMGVRMPPDRTKEFFPQILEQCIRARDIVTKLLMFARKREKKGERKEIDLAPVLDEAIRLVSFGIDRDRIRIDPRFGAEPIRMTGDPEQLRQVFLNVLQNAVQALEEGKGRGTVAITASKAEGQVRVEISDDGPGIKPEDLSRIFDPFFTTKAVGKGTGLGLSICHGIVSDHGGTIRAESGPEGGATFTIELPERPAGA